MSLAVGLCLFLLSCIIAIIGNTIFYHIKRAGLINDHNLSFFYMFNFFLLFILTGIVISVISAILHEKRTDRLSGALQKISDGEFSVRLQQRKLNDSLTNSMVEMFNAMALSLENTEALNNDFISNLSHEMKTPLGTINGFAKMLKDSGFTETEKADYLNIIINESERLSLLSNNIMLLSRLEKQTVPVNREDYNLTEQLRQTVASMYHKWSEKNIEIILEGEDFSVSANRELMVQVWINLLDNGIKFSPADGNIYINVIKNADCVAVSIKNFGATLGGDEISHIFEKFYQGTGEKKALGNGLGLPMVKKITELHGGTVCAELCDDNGIIFTVTLSASQ